jgi:hypothetical protein
LKGIKGARRDTYSAVWIFESRGGVGKALGWPGSPTSTR